jgi:hypothetical protein
MDYDEAVDLLFKHFVNENFLENDYYESGDDVSHELLSFAARGRPAVVDRVVSELDYRLSADYGPSWWAAPVAVTQLLEQEFNEPQLREAAELIIERHFKND